MNINNQIFLAFVLILLNGCNSKNSKIESTSQKNEVEVSPEVKRSAEKSIKNKLKLFTQN